MTNLELINMANTVEITIRIMGWEYHEATVDITKDINEQLQSIYEYHRNDSTLEDVEKAYKRAIEDMEKSTKKIQQATQLAKTYSTKKENDGKCPHCGTYCYGDCRA